MKTIRTNKFHPTVTVIRQVFEETLAPHGIQMNLTNTYQGHRKLYSLTGTAYVPARELIIYMLEAHKKLTGENIRVEFDGWNGPHYITNKE